MSTLIFFGIMMFPMLAFIVAMYSWKYLLDRDDRRSPLNTKLHFTPGEQLRRRIEDIDDRMSLIMLGLGMCGPVFLAVWFAVRMRKLDLSAIQFGAVDYVMGAIVVIAGFAAAYEIVRIGKQRRKCRQGLQGEIAVGQYLLPLMGKGCIVFNDVPADGFNVDHVVIAPNAVFAVETKSRKKPKAPGKESATVSYDGDTLKFPSFLDAKPIEQAKAQARWLATFLAGAAGDPVKVVPVVALPGWWVENTKRSSPQEVWVTNGKNANFMLGASFGPAISESLRNRIAYAITQRYPDLE